jgi:hypothetical protein
MSVGELPTTSQRAWLADGQGERLSGARAKTGAVGWSARRAIKWVAAGLAIVVGFILSAFLYLMMTAPEPTSYLG